VHRDAFLRGLLVACAAVFALAFAGTAGAAKYIVVYKQQAVPSGAQTSVASAGGRVVAVYPQIGVVIASSDSASFRTELMRDTRIDGVSSTQSFAMKLDTAQLGAVDAEGPPPGDLANAPATDEDETLWEEQWDMRQINVPAAHAITGGSREVIAGDLDTGLDWTHPDLAPSIDFSKSVSCTSGAPDPDPAAWQDRLGHGTHTAGTIAAADNTLGIVGVAPNVRLAGVKTSNDDGFFYPEMVVCAFMWAGTNHFDVVNNSYFADPFLFNCHNDKTQQAIWKAEYRAIRYAMTQGVTVVASAGNENQDLAHPTTDDVSPSDGDPVPRDVTNACVRIPAEIPGVVTVTADGNLRQKAYYSDYGIGVVEVVAPGGDRRFQVTPEAKNGRVLSTWPRALFDPSSPLEEESCLPDGVCGTYAYLQGTSMAGPHATGVAALIVSVFGDSQNAGNGHMRPGQVEQFLNQTANPIPCPENPFNPGPPFSFAAECQGGPAYNGFYGHGEVDAYRAVTHDTGN
jgi:lantibiotic leader peptide-processing serine protease